MRHLGILLRLAVRNVLRQRRRSVLIALAMILGVALLIFFLALGDGMHAQWIDAGVRLADGHVTVESPAYRRSASLDDRLDSSATARVQRAVADPSVARFVRAAAPRLTVSALASSASSALPVRVLGVDPLAERRFSVLPQKLVAGRWLADTDVTAAVVGQRLVDRLGLSLGSRFVLTAQTAQGDVQEQLVHVTGIFRTGIREVDEGMIDIPMATARQWLAAPGAETSEALLLGDDANVGATVAALGPLLPAGTRAFTWRETSPELDAAVRVDNFGNYLFNGILLAIVAVAVLEALLVSVLHRRREFGMLQAIGLSARETAFVVLAEGVTLAVVSGALGMAVGFGVTAILGRTGLDLTAAFGNQLSISGAVVSPIVHPVVHLARAWQGAAVVLGLGVLSSTYPMWQASRIDVAQAMQDEP
jgi:ABC-type lipoprotein release transport system permease subunit